MSCNFLNFAIFPSAGQLGALLEELASMAGKMRFSVVWNKDLVKNTWIQFFF